MYSNGTNVGTGWHSGNLGSSPSFSGTLSGGTLLGNNTYAVQGGIVGWQNSSAIRSTTDGIILLQNNAGTDFTRLQFGGTTNAFAALRVNNSATPSIDCVTADASAYAQFRAATLVANNGAVVVSGGQVCYGGSTQTTVGAAGAASAMPTPVGYIQINVAGTAMKLAYFNN